MCVDMQMQLFLPTSAKFRCLTPSFSAHFNGLRKGDKKKIKIRQQTGIFLMLRSLR